MRRAARVDNNQREIVLKLRKLGYSVCITSQLGAGYGDITVGYKGLNFIFEIKDGEKPKSAQKLTPAEAKFHLEWKGQIDIIRTAEDAVIIIDLMLARMQDVQ